MILVLAFIAAGAIVLGIVIIATAHLKGSKK
jgi:hypothetical protein